MILVVYEMERYNGISKLLVVYDTDSDAGIIGRDWAQIDRRSCKPNFQKRRAPRLTGCFAPLVGAPFSLCSLRFRSVSLSSSLSLPEDCTRFAFFTGRTGDDASDDKSAFLLGDGTGGESGTAGPSVDPGEAEARALPL